MPLLFLSHAGVDTEAARALKQRILEAPAVRAAGLEVWFDKDNLDAGQMWQRQLEDALGRSAAFAVYVGSRGVVNWVEAEVRLALSRAMVEPAYRFIPVLAAGAPGAGSLPSFARQFQGVRDVEGNADQFAKLVAAVLGGDGAGKAELEADPFFGLRAIDESRNHLFFGRERETEELLQRVYERPLVLVSGDSGSGKSSLVRAGLVPRFRGGALATLKGERPQDNIWNVVITRPRSRPWIELGNAVEETAKGFGLSLADRGALADWAASRDADKARRALRCGLPAEQVRVLLVVDQFEELVTITPEAERAPFIAFLLSLADPADDRFRIVLTMRHDYVNLCNSFDDLRRRLDADDRRARFLLGRMTDDGLRQIVTEPLRLAGIAAGEREALAADVLKDVGQRPGDLALVQMALTETWRARAANEGHLARAYVAVGRVEGALAQAAEQVRTRELAKPDNTALAPLLDSVLVRIVRLGDTGGATRRIARRTEFDDDRWRLVQLLASEDGKRLVILGGGDSEPTVEIAHEALVTAWPHFQTLLQSVADDKRTFDGLIPKARAWAAAAAKADRLATGAELEQFKRLSDHRAEWLSGLEKDFIRASLEAAADRKRRERWLQRAVAGFALLMVAATIAAVWSAWNLSTTLDRANRALAVSLWNRLDFQIADASSDERNALWEIRLAEASVRQAFFSELAQNPQRPAQLGRNPEPILRAFALHWTPEDAQAAVTSVLKGFDEITDRDQLVPLAAAVQALASKLTAEPARAALARLLKAMAVTNNPDEIESLSIAMQALPAQLTVEQGEEALAAVLKAFADLDNPTSSALESLAAAMRSVAGKFNANQAQAAVVPILKAIPETQDRRRLRGLLMAVQALSGKLPEQPQSILDALLRAFASTTDPYAFSDLAAAAVALPVQFTQEQASAMLAPISKAFDESKDSDQRRWLAIAVQKLAGKLTTEQAKPAVAPILAAMARTSDASELWALAEALQALKVQFLAEQKATLDLILKATSVGPEWVESEAHVATIRALVEKLPTDQAQASLETILDAMAEASNADQLRSLAAVVQALKVPLTAKQAETALAPILSGIAGATDSYAPYVLRTFAEAVQALPVQLTDGQSKAALEDVVKATAGALDTSTYEAFGQAVQALAEKLTPAQAQAMLEVSVTMMGDLSDPDMLLVFAKEVQALAGKLSAEQVQQAFDAALNTIGRMKNPPAPFAPTVEVLTGNVTAEQARVALAIAGAFRAWIAETDHSTASPAALELLAGNVTADQAQAALAVTRSLLAWSRSADDASAWAHVMSALLLHKPSEHRVADIVEALRYPSAGGEATKVLLAALHEAVPEAPGSDAGLEVNLDWIAKNYPTIDLDAPPACPPPPQAGLVCPSAALQ